MTVIKPGEAAKKLKLSKKTTYELIAKGVIPAVRVGHQWRLSEEALERFMDRGAVEVVADSGTEKASAVQEQTAQ